MGLGWGLLVYISIGRCRCFIRSLQMICFSIRLLWYSKVICLPEPAPVCFVRGIWCMVCFKSSRIYGWVGGVTSCDLVRACEIAFSINLPVLSWATVHTCRILVMSPPTLSMKFLNSCFIMLNCCKKTVDWSLGCTLLCWGELFVFWLAEVEFLYVGCVWVLLIFLFWVSKNVSLTIVLNALIPRVQLVVLVPCELLDHYKVLVYSFQVFHYC